MKDTQARRIAVVALFAAVGAFMLGSARADSISEPDAYAVKTQMQALQAQVDGLSAQLDQMNDASGASLAQRVSDLEDSDVSRCLAYSDRHYYKERVGTHGRKWRFPVMLWNMSDATCRPSAAEWKPSGRVFVPVR